MHAMDESGKTTHELFDAKAMGQRYKDAVERAIPHLPVKNGVVDIDSIWVETSIPYEILRDLLQRGDLALPENVERINLKSRTRKEGGSRRGKRRR